jgi:lysophospholipase L1-like esterase
MRTRSVVWVNVTLCALLLLIVIHLVPSHPQNTRASSRGVTIMPLGDSLTQGEGSSDEGGYRTFLWKQYQKYGYRVKFVGTQSSGPGDIDTHNEGHPGWRIDQISAHVVYWLTLYRPQVILLLIGTNDILQRRDLRHISNRLSLLIDRITFILPQSTLLVASVPPLSDSRLYAKQNRSYPSSVDFNANVVAYNATIPSIVRSAVAQGKHVQYVDMYDVVPVYDIEDGIHPNDAGYAFMGNAWYTALTKVLPLPLP